MHVSSPFSDFMSEEELQASISELHTKFAEDKTVIVKINTILETLNDDSLFPVIALQSLHTIFPRLVGESGVNFIIHILRNGISNQELIDDILLLELELMVSKYGILFNNAERYISTPLGYSNLQLMFNSDKEESIIRIIRADKKMFELQMDLASIIRFMSHTIQKVAQIIETKDVTLSEEDRHEILSALYTLLKSSGVVDEASMV